MFEAQESPPAAVLVTIDGGPCSGKTTFLARARQFLENHGFRVFIAREAATEISELGFSLHPHDWSDYAQCQRLILALTVERERRFLESAPYLLPPRPTAVLGDRGGMTGMAYVGPEVYTDVVRSLGLSKASLLDRPKGVIHLVTAADGAETHYTLEDHAARHESPEQARELDARTLRAWYGASHVAVIDNSTGFDEKMLRAIAALARIVGIPEPMERERRFLIGDFTEAMIPADAVMVHIEQHYLVGQEASRRIRKRSFDGESSYYYTEKRPGPRPGERFEIERPLDRDTYEGLLREQEPHTEAVVKRRYCFVHDRQYIEFDVFEWPEKYRNRAIAEIEVTDIDAPVSVPSEWNAREVTELEGYSNYDIACGRMP